MRSEIMLKDFKPNHTDRVTQLKLLTEPACKRVLLAALFCSLLTFVPIASAQNRGAEDDSVIAEVRSSEQLLNDFVNGRELADNALSNSLSNSLSNTLPHSRSNFQVKADGSIQQTLSGPSTAANLVAAQRELLTEFENTVGHPKGFLARIGTTFDQLPEIQNLAPKFKQWQAQHLLYLENFKLTEQKLNEINASSKHLDRLSNTKSSYQSVAEPLLADIEGLLLAHDSSPSASFLKRAGLQQDLHSISDRLNQLVKKSTQEPPILRFSNLPYQALALPQKDIVLEPAITPSYAQATVVEPTIEDSEVGSIEPAVQALAEELGYDPIKLYQYVHSQIVTRWYAGSMLSAGSVIEQGEGNSTDQAVLLSELMRASSIPTRFVNGVVRVPSEKLLDMTAVDGLNQALAVLQRAAVPYQTVVEAGQIRAVLIQQTWLSVYVPYTNYRGASLDRSGQVWLALMPSVKAWSRDESGTLLRDSGFNANTLRESFLQTVQSQDVVEQVKTQLADAVLNQPQGSEPSNQLDTTTLKIQNAGYLPNTLPLSVEAVLSESAVLAKSLSHQVRFIAYRDVNQSQTIMDLTIPVSEIGNKSLSLSYQAGSQDDHDLILSFGGLGLTPLYLVDLRAQIKVNGVPIAVSEEILPAGILHKFSIEFNGPAGSYRVDKVVRSGNYHGIGITAQDARSLETEENFETSGGRILSQIALRYLSDWSEAERALSQLLKRQIVQPLPNLVFASNDVKVNVEAVLGQPISFDFLGVNLDAALRITESLAARPDAFSERDFATLSALQGSYLEHAVFERLFGVKSISADKGLALAVSSGNNVLGLNTESISELELTLGSHSASVINAVRDWLQLGFDVLIPVEQLAYLEWSGSVWVVTDPLTGEAGYFISRGLAGGATAEPFPGDIGGLLADPTSQGTNFDSSQATSITLFNNTNFQTVAAGQEYEALAVHVRDNQGLAVAGAEVVFDHSVSVGEFVTEEGVTLGANGSASVVTDLQGVARVTYRAPEIILDSPDISFLLEDSGDTIPTRVALNYIEVRVEPTGQSALRAEQFFTLLTLPGDPVELFHDLETGTGLVGQDNAEIGFDEIYVRDEFGNTVANIDVLVETKAVRPEGVPDGLPESEVVITPHRISTPDCDKLTFSFTNCGSTSITYKSNSLGFVSVGVILGEVKVESARVPAEYPVNISIDEDTQIELAYQVSDFLAVFNGVGPNRFSAVKVGGTYRGSGFESANPSIGRIVQGEPRIERMEALNVAMQLDDFEGEATFTNITPSSFSGGADIEYTNMAVGNEPGYYTPVITWSYLGDPAEGEGELLQRSQATLQRVAAVRITPTNPNPLELAKDLLPQRFGPLKYEHEPADYKPTYEVLEVFEDGELIDTVVGKNGEVNIPPIPLDPAKKYHAEVVYNLGSEFDEVRSDRFELPVTAPVIFRAGAETQNERAGRVSRGGGGGGSIIIDRVNGRTCNAVEPTFSLDLVQEAKVTIETLHPDFKSPERFITRKTLDAGLTEFDLKDIAFRKAFLREGVTRVFITAESTETGRIDTLESRFSFSETNINVLPVGSPTYENVNLWNGSLFLSKTDVQVPGRGPNLEFSRNYSSQNRSASSLGPGWSHNYDSFVQITPCGWVVVSGGVGGGVTFFPQADGYKAGIGYHSSLERNEGNWDFYAKDGTRYHYSQRFRINFAPVTVLSPVYLEYIEDTNGNRTSLGYSPGGHRAPQLDFIRDSSGRQINLEYLAIQQLAAIASGGLNEDGSPIDPEDIKNIKPSAVNDLYGFPRNVITRVTGLGYDIAYDYDENGRLVEATNYQDRGNLSEELPEGESITEVYQYQDITDLTPDFPGLGFDVQTATAIEAIIDPRGIKTDYSYIRRERELLLALNGNEFTLPYTSAVVQVTEISKTDDLNLPINNANDIVSKLEYFDRLSSDELPTVEITDPRNVLYRHTMDLVGRGVQVDGPTGSRFMSWTPNDTLMLSETDENGVLKEYQYDQDGNQTQERVSGLNGDSFTTTSRYQREGYNGTIRNLIRSRTDRRGNTTDYDYDVRGNLKTITHPSTPACVAPCAERFTYLANGDLSDYSDERNKRTAYAYDQYGNVRQTNLPIGITVGTFDERSRLLESADENSNSTRFEYDWLNRLTLQTNAEGGRRLFEYDPNNNKTVEVDEEARSTVLVYDFDNRLIEQGIKFGSGDQLLSVSKTMAYDTNDNQTSVTDYRGNATTLEYDDANRVTLQRYPENEQGFAKTQAYTYDNTNSILTTTVSGDSSLAEQVTSFDYDNLYRQTQVTDAEAGVTQINYDGNDNVIEQIDELGRITQVDYDAMNRKVAQRDAVGTQSQRASAWQYDRAGNLLKTIDARGNSETHAYDDKNRRIFHTNLGDNRYVYEYDDYGNLTDEFDHFGNHVEYQYDELHRRTKVIDQRDFESATDYDLVGNPIQETQFNGNVISRGFDFLNRVVSEVDRIGPVMSYTYDDDNNALTHTDGKGFVTTYVYDALSQRTGEIQPENRTLATQYDVYGNLSQSTDGEGNITRLEYDKLNRNIVVIDALAQQVMTRYDPVDNAVSITDKRGNTTDHEYDALNRVVKIIAPEAGTHSREVSNVYDANDNLLQTTDKRGIVTRYQYDRLNRVAEQQRSGIRVVKNTYSEIGDLIGLEDANGNVTAMEFNERHEMVLESRPETAISTYVYDAMGDVLSMRDPEQREMSYGYDLRQRKLSETNGENETTSYAFDLNNNQIQKTRPEGNQWQYDYDELNRLVTITDANSQESAYAYDRQNNLSSQTDANGNVTRYEYDVLNRKALKRYPITTQGEAICSYDYDPNNNLLVKTDANGQSDTHSYDALNRLTNKEYANPQGSVGRDMTSEAMAYDGNNNVTSVTETYGLASGGTEVRVDSKTYDDFDRLFNRTDSFNKTIRYGYDLNGNRTRLTDSDGIITTYRFDGLNRVKDVRTQQGITAYQYDRSSLLTQTSYPNNTTASYSYDQAKRSIRIHNQQNNATVSNYEYVFDDNGNRVEQKETNGGAQELTLYQFDLNDRLLEVAYDVQAGTPDVTTTYTYDAAYNRTSEVDTTISGVTKNKTYRYNPRNQLTNVDDNLDNASNAAYAFDQNGNQIQKVKQGETTNFVFDIRDDLREVKIGGSTVGQFLYDYQGLRIEKLGERGAERNTYDAQSILQQYQVAGCTTIGDTNCATGTTGQTRAKFDYGASSLLSLNAQGEPTQFYLYDVLNSVANLTNSDGAVQARYQYDAWGIKRNQVGTSYNRFSFTGYEEDKETGLLYAKARYYDPDTGKFLSEDAWEGDNMIAPSLHRYLYGYQNPTVYVDLDGNFPVTQQVRDFFRNQAANQARTSRDLTASLGDGFFSDVGVRSLNAASGIGNALFSVAGEAVNLVDLGLDSGVGSSRMLSNTKVGQESRARVKGTREFLKNTAKTAASKTQAAVKEKGFIGATGDAIGSSASKTGNFLHKAYIEGDLDAGAKLSGGLYTGAVPVAGASKLLGRGRRGSSNDSTTGQKADLVGESNNKVQPDVPNAGAADEIAALRRIGLNNRSNTNLHHKINLRGEVRTEYQRLLDEGASFRGLGPALAGAKDLKTGQTFFGTNHQTGLQPSIQSPKIPFKAIPDDVLQSYSYTKGAGSHAEVNALNNGLLNRQGAGQSDFLLEVINSGGSKATRGNRIPRCPHCNYLTDGADFPLEPKLK